MGVKAANADTLIITLWFSTLFLFYFIFIFFIFLFWVGGEPPPQTPVDFDAIVLRLALTVTLNPNRLTRRYILVPVLDASVAHGSRTLATAFTFNVSLCPLNIGDGVRCLATSPIGPSNVKDACRSFIIRTL